MVTMGTILLPVHEDAAVHVNCRTGNVVRATRAQEGNSPAMFSGVPIFPEGSFAQHSYLLVGVVPCYVATGPSNPYTVMLYCARDAKHFVMPIIPAFVVP